MKTLVQITMLISIILLSSCNKDDTIDEVVIEKNIKNLSVPDGFLFKTEQNVLIKFSIDYEEPYAVVEVYKDDPNKKSSVILAGKLVDNKFEQNVILPVYANHVFIRLKTNNGMSKFFDIPIQNNIAEYQYISNTQNTNNRSLNLYDCNANCTQTLANSGVYNNISVNEGETLCIPEGVIVSGSININGGTLSVCGTVYANVNLNGTNPTIIIGETGNISINNFNSNVTIINYKDNLSLPYTINGYLENYASLNFSGSLTINSDGKLVNYGTVNISGTLINNGEISNNSYLNTTLFTQNSSGKFTNNCNLSIGANLTQMSSFLVNNSYMSIGAILEIKSGASIELSENSFINCNYLRVNGSIINNSPNYARIEIGTECSLYSSSVIDGYIDICDNNGIELSDGYLGTDIQYCQTAIPSNNCNPGIGEITVIDTDSDGITDNIDLFPSDPDRGFISYYPENGYGTFAFEDLWPYKGDFDFNDLVVNYKYKLITNSVGFVKEIEYTCQLMAAGGSFKNGFGIEFPVDANFVESNTEPVNLFENMINLTNKNIESNQTKAVAILFDNAIKTLVYPGGNVTGINTTNDAPYAEPKTITGSIIFSIPQDILPNLPFNPFIFIDLDRGKEVHLMVSTPTDLANNSYFNTGQDDSNNGIYYKTENNLPWAINIIEEFDHPTEKSEITSAYLYFFDWASSGGVNNANWYLDISGNRNSELIFTPLK